MKINATSSIYPVESYRTQSMKSATSASARPENDKVVLSTEALSFADAFSAVKASIDVHVTQSAASVENIRAQVAAGTYTVDTDDLASSILLFT